MTRVRWLFPCIALLGAACGPEGPALVVSLQVSEASGTDIDTSNIHGLLLRVGDEQVPFNAQPQQQFEIEFATPPEGATAVVLYACEIIAACRPAEAAFVGCSTPVLQASATPQPVFLSLYPMPPEGEPPPPGCGGLL
ncbi:MAG: hypothetical protein FJ137_15010 [Deltaproteobacteria bacterium]|nr:hypothetical protein [Deltaproteobacteria bacterium]